MLWLPEEGFPVPGIFSYFSHCSLSIYLTSSFKSCCKAFSLEIITCGLFFLQQFSTTGFKVWEWSWVPAPKIGGNLLDCRHQARRLLPSQAVPGHAEPEPTEVRRWEIARIQTHLSCSAPLSSLP